MAIKQWNHIFLQILLLTALSLSSSQSFASKASGLSDYFSGLKQKALDWAESSAKNPPSTHKTATAKVGEDGVVKYTKENIFEHMGKNLTARAKAGDFNDLFCPPNLMAEIKMKLLSPQLKNVMIKAPAGVGKTTMAQCFARTLVEFSAESKESFQQKLKNDYKQFLDDIVAVEKKNGNDISKEDLFDQLFNNSEELIHSWRRQEVIAFDFSDMMGGTSYRGQLEEKLQALRDRLESDGNVIAFFDEAHLVAKNSEQGNDIGNVIKPMMTEGKAKTIFATTDDEFEAFIAKDDALTRRFHVINLKEPTEEEAFQIVKSQVRRYELNYGIKITDDAIKATIAMAKDFSELALPGSVFKILDTAAGRKSIVGTHSDSLNILKDRLYVMSSQGLGATEEYRALYNNFSALNKFFKKQLGISVDIANKQDELKSIIKKTDINRQDNKTFDAIKDQQYSKDIVKLEEEISQLTRQRGELVSKSLNELPTGSELKILADFQDIGTLNRSDVEKSIAKEFDIAEEVLHRSNDEAIAELDSSLRRMFPTQKASVQPIKEAEQLRVLGFANKKPMVYLSIGSGDASHALARIIKKSRTGKDDVLEFDLSQTHHRLESLIGQEMIHGQAKAGSITKAVRKNPFQVVILKNIEDTQDPRILQFLKQLQINPRAKVQIYDNIQSINFQHTTFILQSDHLKMSDDLLNHLATKEGVDQSFSVAQALNKVGDNEAGSQIAQQISQPLTELVKKVDGTVIWRNLKEDDVVEIARAPFNRIVGDLKNRNIQLDINPSTLKYIISQLRDLGVDDLSLLDKFINEKILKKISRFYNEGKISVGDHVRIDADDNYLYITIKKAGESRGRTTPFRH